MKSILMAAILVLSAATAAVACPGPYGAPPPPAQSPDAFLHSIYDRYIGENQGNIDYSKESELRRYFTPEVVALITKDQAAAATRDEVPTLDGDPFVGAQEWKVASFDIKSVQINATRAEATVKFTNYERHDSFKVSLWLVGGAWKIDDIDYGGDAGTLRGMFKNPN